VRLNLKGGQKLNSLLSSKVCLSVWKIINYSRVMVQLQDSLLQSTEDNFNKLVIGFSQ
jgi:hypothetical protein